MQVVSGGFSLDLIITAVGERDVLAHERRRRRSRRRGCVREGEPQTNKKKVSLY